MILQALCEYYERKAADPESQIAPEGLEWKEIPFLLVIDKTGDFVRIDDTREFVGNKKVAKRFLLPQGEKRAAGIKANFIWDSPEYVLGANPRNRKDVQARHKAFTDRMHDILAENNEQFPIPAIFQFLDNKPLEQIESKYKGTEIWEELMSPDGNTNLTFWIDGEHDGLVFNYVKNSMKKIINTDNSINGYCLVTGKETCISRIHPSIKGVKDGQPMGCSLVSFQVNSGYDSYGKEKSYNAPLSEYATFAYTTALSYLLRKGSPSKVQIGDATTVFWGQKDDSCFEHGMGSFFAVPFKEKDDPDKGALDTKQALFAFLSGISPEESSTKFYILGLAPNSARIAVRFWHSGLVSDYTRNMKQHLSDLEIIWPRNEPQRMSMVYLLGSTVLDWKTENIPPNLCGNMIRSVLLNSSYPETLLNQCIRRIRADQAVKPVHAAILKACLNRKLRRSNPNNEKEIAMSLDITNMNEGYRLGRLFAVLEKIQEDTSPGINATIRDRYYGSASANPVTVFPRLINLSNHYLSKLKVEKPAFAVNNEKWLTEIIGGIENTFPAHMKMEDQAKFAIGYYHQKQAFYVSNKDKVDTTQGEEK